MLNLYSQIPVCRVISIVKTHTLNLKHAHTHNQCGQASSITNNRSSYHSKTRNTIRWGFDSVLGMIKVFSYLIPYFWQRCKHVQNNKLIRLLFEGQRQNSQKAMRVVLLVLVYLNLNTTVRYTHTFSPNTHSFFWMYFIFSKVHLKFNYLLITYKNLNSFNSVRIKRT